MHSSLYLYGERTLACVHRGQWVNPLGHKGQAIHADLEITFLGVATPIPINSFPFFPLLLCYICPAVRVRIVLLSFPVFGVAAQLFISLMIYFSIDSLASTASSDRGTLFVHRMIVTNVVSHL